MGSFIDSNCDQHGFHYDGTNWTQLDVPGAVSTSATGIDGTKSIGEAFDASFATIAGLYDGDDYIHLDLPFSNFSISDIDGTRVTGTYWEQGRHGFVIEIPEPATGLAVALLVVFVRPQRR